MFKPEDLAKYRAFRAMVHQAELKLEGKAVVLAASLFQWFDSLEKKMNATMAWEAEMKKEPIQQVVKEESNAD